jgi:thiol-disulfide isomerase/thioredoxin
MVRYAFLPLVVLAGLPAWSQPCEPSPALQEAIHPNSTQSRLEQARAALQKFPSDYFAHERYQTVSLEGGVYPAAVRDEYRALRDAHPEDPLYLALYARALTGTTTPEAIKLLGHVLEMQPDYPPAHLQLAYIHNSTQFADAAKVRSNLEAYWKACPASTLGYDYVARTEDIEFMRQSAARLRVLADRAATEDDLPPYSVLWSLEFKATPLAEQDAVRGRVRKDVEHLRAAFTKHPGLIGQLSDGYKLLGDQEGVKWVEEHAPAGASPSSNAAMQAISKWHSSHQMKSNDRQFLDAYQAQTAEWIRQWPDDAYARSERFTALRMDQDAPLEEQLKAAEEWLRVYEAHHSGSSPYIRVAQFYASKNTRYDQLPGVLEKGLKDLPEPRPRQVSDLNPPPSASSRIMQSSNKWSTWQTAASTYIKIKRYDDARKLLALYGASLKEARPADDVSASDKSQFNMWDRQYWDAMAKLAQAESHNLDALAYLRNADFLMPAASADGQSYYSNQARIIWKDLGGSDEAFDAWMTPRNTNGTPSAPATRPAIAGAAQPWAQIDKPLPEFHLSDMEGRNWDLAAFKGKATLVNLWATWCGPCRNELPYLQKVLDKVRERKDIQLVTFNVDDNPGLIAPFLTENKYTFPVVSAKSYIDKFLRELSIPRNWIVDSGGVLRSERIGFGTGDDKWVDDIVASLERAAGPSAK